MSELEHTYAGPDTSGVRILPPLLFLAGLAVGLVLHWLWPIGLVSPERLIALRVVGIVFIACGLVLPVWARRTFHRAGTTPNPMRPTTALTFDGPYRFTRNPMYLGLTVIQVGIALAMNAAWLIVLLPVFLVILQREVIDREERYLEAKFGEEFRRYKVRVRRWL